MILHKAAFSRHTLFVAQLLTINTGQYLPTKRSRLTLIYEYEQINYILRYDIRYRDT